MSETIDPDGEFQVKIASTGAMLDVPANVPIVEVLWDNGIDVETSCESGLCATCMVRYVDGTPDHRDEILEDDQRDEYLTVCCSRSRTPVLVLDL